MSDYEITEIAFTKANLPYGWLGNMTSKYPVYYDNHMWSSTENLFQALRFEKDSEIFIQILNEKNPFKAKLIAKSNREHMIIVPLSDIDIDNMRICLELKINQYPELKEILLNSKGLMIYEDVTSRGSGNSNLLWGAMKLSDGLWKGENILGKLWMELRDKL